MHGNWSSLMKPCSAKWFIFSETVTVSALSELLLEVLCCTQLVLSTGSGVNGFTLDPSLGEFIMTHPEIKVLCVTQIMKFYLFFWRFTKKQTTHSFLLYASLLADTTEREDLFSEWRERQELGHTYRKVCDGYALRAMSLPWKLQLKS
jgi:hypothetical protein